MIAVGVVKEQRGPAFLVSIDGDLRSFRTDLELKKGDMVMVSGDRLVKKLEVVK
jgi:hypothetical protein